MKEGNKRANKKGQITIFIIIALVVIVGIVVYFLWIKPQYTSSSAGLSLEGCMKKAVQDSIDGLAEKGGYNTPGIFYKYNGQNVAYICYTNLYYKPCINQEPFLKDNFEKQLLSLVQEKVYSCYDNSLSNLRRQGYDVTGGNKNITISLNPGLVNVELDAPVSVSKETTSQFTKFVASVNSPIYDILMIATSIVQQETKYGDSDTATMTIFYPELSIDKIRRDDGTDIYIIQNKDYSTKFQFAVRSLVYPAGYGTDTGLVMK